MWLLKNRTVVADGGCWWWCWIIPVRWLNDNEWPRWWRWRWLDKNACEKSKTKLKQTERQLLGSWFCYGSVWIQLGCSTGSCKMLQLKKQKATTKSKSCRSAACQVEMLTKKAATAVNYFEYFSPTPHAVQWSLKIADRRQKTGDGYRLKTGYRM